MPAEFQNNVSRETFSNEDLQWLQKIFNEKEKSLKQYADLILWWNKKLNLVSRDSGLDDINRHIVHSLTLSLVPSVKTADILLDVGTGGGLPGVPLAIIRDHYTESRGQHVILCDKVEKKLWAVKQMVSKLNLLNVHCLSKDINNLERRDLDWGTGDVSRETLVGEQQNVVVISKHAFKFDDLMHSISEKVTTEFVLLKGFSEAKEELSRVEEPFTAEFYPLEEFFGDPFYAGKAVVHVKRA
ncbi:MAG: hypothetical protein EBR32_03175 [Bacteroidetes bacterium]|nr:hypothetical protein [Bacteroidota bacterium]